ncbi:CRISPR-associated helicase Cas3' [Megamonas hypermegale]|uniref:CRISPR-associated helicase Cas3' n=1 Tax=Megamonas hypermegale TaxID=158847 RepID=UPI00195CE453|nr:CRISPR-associated helicase Cas3' [Megamonas hypermegale]MBM6832331.1 CRISPR-associated helicase Cas3' [Megamonas hypermegale]
MEADILKNLVKNINRYKAHKKSKDNEIVYETLLAHTELTNKYFIKFWQSKNSDEIFDRFCNVFWQKENIDNELKNKAKDLLKEIIMAIPIFHDMGKVNPNFQLMKLKVNDFKENKAYVNTHHSFLSSMFYMDYCRKLVYDEKNEDEIVNLLAEFILYNGYIIARHHSELGSLTEFTKLINLDDDTYFSKLKQIINNEDIYSVKIDFIKSDIEDMFRNLNKVDKDAEKVGRRSIKQGVYLSIYIRWLYSLLVASDYYATSEFMNDTDFSEVSDLDNIGYWNKFYEETSLLKSIRKYQKTKYPLSDEELNTVKDINILRSEIFCEVEEKIKANADKNIFYLEAPTGSGKSNTAINASFKLMQHDDRLQKIFYIYPFNTLVEQNLETLEKIFADNEAIKQNIAVINSITPIKVSEKDLNDNEEKDVYQKALLDRQFLNYPMILSTHVSLFNIIFGNRQSDVFAFYQLANSVIVLDEIQSYKNKIWAEIICYLKELAKMFNIKIIIMSATLPDLDILSRFQAQAVNLLENPSRFFAVNCFKNRVKLNYDLLKVDKDSILDELKTHLKQYLKSDKKILIEFIKKKTAHDFWVDLQENEDFKDVQIEYLSGDDSIAERKRILDKVKKATDTMILVSTQVIEAGVDIDMDIGYKNISKLDSEEQFLGRINRSCKKEGIAYFFEVDEASDIYKDDVRLSESIVLKNVNMQKILELKLFDEYYKKVLKTTMGKYGYHFDEFIKDISDLNYESISTHMKLIDDTQDMVQIYIIRTLCVDGEVLDGKQIWDNYVDLWENGRKTMSYAEWKIELSRITSKMNNFIYQVSKHNLHIGEFYEQMGNIICLDDGDKYFTKDKFNREMLQGVGGIDFI